MFKIWLSGQLLPGDMSIVYYNIRTILGPCTHHLRAIFKLFILYLCLLSSKVSNFTKWTVSLQGTSPSNTTMLGKWHMDHTKAFCYSFAYISAFTCQKQLKFALGNPPGSKKYYTMTYNYFDHIQAIFVQSWDML